jgi:2-isopropylmalate synthase
VLIDSTDGEGEWTTVGVHDNIVEASWHALVDALTYAVRHRHVPGVRPAPRPTAVPEPS